MTASTEQLLLQRAAESLRKARERIHELEANANPAIAIVGMSCRLPGGIEGPDLFWQHLCEARDGVREIPLARWGLPEAAARAVAVRWAGVVEDIESFDASLFGISAREASQLDPQQRMLLELVWSALEEAGMGPAERKGRPIGVYVGATTHDFGDRILTSGLAPTPFSVVGASNSFLAGRVAHFFGLNGPGLVIDTACSSSLVALHVACQALRDGSISAALVGGVSALSSAATMTKLNSAQALSPNGKCRTFDAGANGFVRGEGGGVVVLKRLGDARRDGNFIWATVLGSALTHDGSDSGLTQPSPGAQARAIANALNQARVEPHRVGFVETHGTGTSLGDPVEVDALRTVLDGADSSTECWLGAVKTGVGHLEAAAGVVAIIKTALVLHHAQVPPNLHFTRLNPRIDLTGSRLCIPNTLVPWAVPAAERFAGVSSFGLSGTNAHVVLGAEPEQAAEELEEKPLLLTLSANSESALSALATRWADALTQAPSAAQSACALAVRTRSQLPYRVAVVGVTADELASALRSARARRVERGALAFVFSGQVGWSRETIDAVAAAFPVFRSSLERCASYLQKRFATDPFEELARGSERPSSATLQTGLFSVQIALTELLADLGVRPTHVTGHSLGEYAAAVTAGVLSVEDALGLLHTRGSLMDRLEEPGAMLAVDLAEQEARRSIAHDQRLALAAVNSRTRSVISGPRRALHELAHNLAERGLRARELSLSHGFHSVCVDPMLDAFAAEAGTVALRSARLPWFSSLTGAAVEETVQPRFWRRHARDPVLFSAAIAALRAAQVETFLEVGLQSTLAALVAEEVGPAGLAIPLLRKGGDPERNVMQALGELFTRGVPAELDKLARTVSGPLARMPGYPFERQAFPLPEVAPNRHDATRTGHALLEPALELASGGAVYEIKLRPLGSSWLLEHRIRGDLVVPGAALLELAAAAARDSLGCEAVELREVRVERAVVLRDGATYDLQLQVEPAASGYSFALRGRAHGERGAWTAHARGRFASADPALTDGAELGAPDVTSRERDCSSYYEALQSCGLELGPRFRGLQRIRAGQRRVEATLNGLGGEREYVVHPATLDAALQSLGAAMYEGAIKHLYVPVSVERAAFYRSTGGALTCMARVEGERDAALVHGDVELRSVDGEIVCRFQGVGLRRLDARLGESSTRPLLHRLRYEEEALDRRPQAAPLRCVVVPGHRGLDASFVRRLAGFQLSASLLDPGLLDGVASAQAWFAMNPEVDVLLDARALDDGEQPVLDAGLRVHELLAAAAQARTRTRMIFVTSGGFSLDPADLSGPVAQAAVWGLVRSARVEHPELACELVDLDAEPASLDALAALVMRTPTLGRVPGMAVRAGRALRLTLEPRAEVHTSPCFGGDGAHVISGGFGGVGLALAGWLIERGARQLVLVGRSQPSASARLQLDAWRERGARVLSLVGDVCDPLTAQRAVREAGAPIVGVFHLAGTLEDGVLARQSAASFRAVLGPKLQGAENLARATEAEPVRWFLVMSSIAALFGAPGQSNYAAANAALEAWSCARQATGKPATCVVLGPLFRIGMAARSGELRTTSWVEGGVRPLDEEALLRGLGAALMAGSGRWIVADFDQELAATPTPRAWLREELARLAPASRAHVMLQRLAAMVGRVLGQGTRALSPERPLMDLGIDSLAALELRNELCAAMGVQIGTNQLFDSANLDALSRNVLDLSGLSADAEPKHQRVVVEAEDEPLDEVADIDSLFESKLAELDAEGR